MEKSLMNLYVPDDLRDLLASKKYGKRILEIGRARWRICVERVDDPRFDPVIEAIPRNIEAGHVVAYSTVSVNSAAYLDGAESFRDAVDACKEIQAAARKELKI